MYVHVNIIVSIIWVVQNNDGVTPTDVAYI